MQSQNQNEPDILAIAGLTDLPRQRVNLRPVTAFQGVQIQQIKVAATAPMVNNQAPLTLNRVPLGGGSFRYRVQFIAPPANQPYSSTSILLRTPSGSTTIATSGNAGPLVFTNTKLGLPTSAVIQQTTPDGAVSDPRIGGFGGNSRGLNIL